MGIEEKVFRLRNSPGMLADACNGCAVCLLSCPVWRQTHDQALTFCGRMRAMQGGAGLAEIAASVNNCTLCGSCEPVCSYGVESVMRTIEMRAELGEGGGDHDSEHRSTHALSGTRVLLANHMLRAAEDMLGNAVKLLGSAGVHPDSGDDISGAMERGRHISGERIKSFISSLQRADDIITTDGLVHRLLRRFLPEAKITPLGKALLDMAAVRGNLGPDDMYVIDARTYNADFRKLVGFYDGIRASTGVMMNLDLHRVAIPTGASLYPSGGVVDPLSQAGWILKGRSPSRIIVERMEDIEPFRAVAQVPVVFVAVIG